MMEGELRFSCVLRIVLLCCRVKKINCLKEYFVLGHLVKDKYHKYQKVSSCVQCRDKHSPSGPGGP